MMSIIYVSIRRVPLMMVDSHASALDIFEHGDVEDVEDGSQRWRVSKTAAVQATPATKPTTMGRRRDEDCTE